MRPTTHGQSAVTVTAAPLALSGGREHDRRVLCRPSGAPSWLRPRCRVRRRVSHLRCRSALGCEL